jgi:hypothetical protein
MRAQTSRLADGYWRQEDAIRQSVFLRFESVNEYWIDSIACGVSQVGANQEIGEQEDQ